MFDKASHLLGEGAWGKGSEDSSTAGLNGPVSRFGGIRMISSWIRLEKSPSRRMAQRITAVWVAAWEGRFSFPIRLKWLVGLPADIDKPLPSMQE